MAKYYISGPITGTANYIERFAVEEKELTERGYSVINPAKVNAQLPDDTTYEQYMKMSLIMLDMCDTIYMLAGWKNSNGACLEYQYAKTLGKNIIFEEMEEQEIDEPKREIWANAVLKDGKLIFWKTGYGEKDLFDFNKDFYYSGLKMREELATGRYELVKQKIEKFEDDKYFYKQYKLYEPFKGIKPY